MSEVNAVGAGNEPTPGGKKIGNLNVVEIDPGDVQTPVPIDDLMKRRTPIPKGTQGDPTVGG